MGNIKVAGKSGGWSAPLPISVTSSGIGITIGYTEIDSLIVLDSEEATREFLKTQVSLDSHLTLAAGSKLSADASETALDIRNPGNSFKRFSFSVSRGVMVDASWNGAGFSVKDDQVQQLFGEGVTREDVLSGKVPSPPAMTQLYGSLNRAAFFASNVNA